MRTNALTEIDRPDCAGLQIHQLQAPPVAARAPDRSVTMHGRHGVATVGGDLYLVRIHAETDAEAQAPGCAVDELKRAQRLVDDHHVRRSR